MTSINRSNSIGGGQGPNRLGSSSILSVKTEELVSSNGLTEADNEMKGLAEQIFGNSSGAGDLQHLLDQVGDNEDRYVDAVAPGLDQAANAFQGPFI